MSPTLWIGESIRYGQDPETGTVIEQLTSEPVTSTNIYCEQRYASADGTRIAISRKPFGQPAQLWVCDLQALRLCRIGEGSPLGANFSRNAVYYSAPQGTDTALMRLDLTDLSSRELFRFEGAAIPHVGAVSPDERWFVGGPLPVRDNRFRLLRIDLSSGACDTLCEIEDMVNPHVQFEPGGGSQVLVQVNRGAQWNPPDGKQKLTGPLGATLCVVSVESGAVLSLPVGRPCTTGISGHECWVGRTGRLIFTAAQYEVTPSAYVTLRDAPDGERQFPAAAIYSVAPGDEKATVVAQGLLFNHLAASDDGRFFIADDHSTGRIYIGNMATGRYLGLCNSDTRQGTCQHSHVHAYMTPDSRWIVFNSIATGIAQVYAARIPDGFLEAVAAKDG
jgi:hypothetical protein